MPVARARKRQDCCELPRSAWKQFHQRRRLSSRPGCRTGQQLVGVRPPLPLSEPLQTSFQARSRGIVSASRSRSARLIHHYSQRLPPIRPEAIHLRRGQPRQDTCPLPLHETSAERGLTGLVPPSRANGSVVPTRHLGRRRNARHDADNYLSVRSRARPHSFRRGSYLRCGAGC